MSITKSKDGRRFDEEFKREAADLASKPGAKQEQVARAPGVSPHSVSCWKKQYAPAPVRSSPGVNAPPELARENRALRRENEDLRQQRAILKKHSPWSRKPRAEAWRDQQFIGRVPRQGALSRAGRQPPRLLRGAKEGRAAARQRQRDSARPGAKIKDAFEASRRTYGSLRLAVALRRTGETCGRHRVARRRRVHRLPPRSLLISL